MWRRIWVGIVAIVVIIVVAAAVAPYFVGRAAESNFKAQVAYINARYANRGISLHVDAYHRGFYSSDALISLSIAPPMNDKEVLKFWKILLGSGGKPEFHLHINHGPVPFDAFGYGHWNFMPVLYTAEFQGENLPVLSIIGAFKPDLYVVQSFTGSTHARVSLPPGRLNLGIFGAKWQGGHFVADLNAARDRVHYKAVIKPFHVQFMNPESGQDYEGEMAGWHASGSRHKARHDFWVGPGRSISKGVTLTRDGNVILKLTGISVAKQYSESDNGRSYSASYQATQHGGMIRSWPFSGFSVDLSVNKLDAAGLRQLVDTWQARAQALRAGQGGSMTELNLLRTRLVRAIDADTTGTFNASLTAPDGTASFTAHVTFTAAPAAVSTDAARYFSQHMMVTADANFDRKLVGRFAVQVLEAPTAKSVNRALERAERQGYVSVDAQGRYHSKLRYRQGVFTVNGKPVETFAPTPASSD